MIVPERSIEVMIARYDIMLSQAQQNAVPFESSSSDFPDLPDDVIADLVTSIDSRGYAVVSQYVKPSEIDALRVFVEDAVQKSGGNYVSFTGYQPLMGTVLERMAKSPSFRRLCTKTYERATGIPAPDQPYYQIARCLSGQSGQKHSLRFHYDSYVLTVLLPIHVPHGQNSGDLVVLPNVRKVRSSYALNLIDKIIIDNPLTQTVLRALIRKPSPRLVRIKMNPGDLYLFWGYRSVHTNEPCDPDKIRATALFHYVDPHSESSLKRFLGRLS